MKPNSKKFAFMDKDRQDFLRIKHKEASKFINPDNGKIYKEYVEEINCPICDVNDSSYVFSKSGFDFVKCNLCGLLHVNPQLKLDIQDKIYKNSKTADYWIKVQKKSEEQNWNFIKKYKPALNELAKLRPGRGKLLDIGCSIGQFMKHAKDDGWDVVGIELNKDAAEIAKRSYNLEVFTSKIEETDFGDNKFDVVTLWGVFEHLTDPNFMLHEIKKVLKKNGLVLFFVPNGHSLIIRMSRDNNSTVSGRAHLWYFTPNTINKILNKNGYSKISEFSILPQIHEIEHFLQYNTLYYESNSKNDEEFIIGNDIKGVLESFINENKLGYKLITIAKYI